MDKIKLLVTKALASKTLMFSYALAIFGALSENFSYLQSLLSPKVYGISFVVIGIVVAVLRLVTTMDLKDK